MRLEVLPVEDIIPDPDVQFDWSYRPEWIKRRLGEGGYDPDKAGVVNVSKLNGVNTGKYGVWWGRHRHALAVASGIRTIRCDVDDGLSPAQKHAIKLAKDRDQRKVQRVETFLNECGAGQEFQLHIKAVCERNGYEVGPLSGGKPLNRFEAVGTLEHIEHWRPGLLDRTFAFGTIWKGDPKTNQGLWIYGLACAVDDGWTDRTSASGYERLRGAVPTIVIRKAIGMATSSSSTKGVNAEVARLISDVLRRTAGVRLIKSKEG